MEGTMTEIVGNAIAPDARGNSGIAPPSEGTIETQLAEEITTLWSDHVRLSANHKTTARELRQIRASLAERLFAMKKILSRPDAGRGGQWRSWLRERRIPRSTADRLVTRHAETLGIENEKVPSGAISESPKETAAKLAKAAWPRLKNVLTTHEAVLQFLGSIAEVSGAPHEWREEGLMIFSAVPEAADELPSSATGPASQPFDGGDAEEPAAEAATAIPATEQAAGDGDDRAEAVV